MMDRYRVILIFKTCYKLSGKYSGTVLYSKLTNLCSRPVINRQAEQNNNDAKSLTLTSAEIQIVRLQ
ncbi:hypothetical protein ABN09_05130 [Morganella morganii]|nr:hypothetical protein ABN09_05130 [Morganella morganii]